MDREIQFWVSWNSTFRLLRVARDRILFQLGQPEINATCFTIGVFTPVVLISFLLMAQFISWPIQTRA